MEKVDHVSLHLPFTETPMLQRWMRLEDLGILF